MHGPKLLLRYKRLPHIPDHPGGSDSGISPFPVPDLTFSGSHPLSAGQKQASGQTYDIHKTEITDIIRIRIEKRPPPGSGTNAAQHLPVRAPGRSHFTETN